MGREIRRVPPDGRWPSHGEAVEASWFQVFQTVSEASPVSPPFATRGALADYLAAKGDFWDQHCAAEEGRRDSGWGRERADAFCELGWSPSAAVMGGRVITNPGEIASEVSTSTPPARDES